MILLQILEENTFFFFSCCSHKFLKVTGLGIVFFLLEMRTALLNASVIFIKLKKNSGLLNTVFKPYCLFVYIL